MPDVPDLQQNVNGPNPPFDPRSKGCSAAHDQRAAVRPIEGDICVSRSNIAALKTALHNEGVDFQH
jgi:hypothetical protein